MKIYSTTRTLAILNMFGSEAVFIDRIQDADFVQFMGGADVHPQLYGEAVHPTTHANPGRDAEDLATYKEAILYGIPMAGICRGGQFLHVMNGGKMLQHVYKHAIHGTHLVTDPWREVDFQATSTHHQMMRENPSALVLATASLEGGKESMKDKEIVQVDQELDMEVLFYRQTRSLCFQPHPEYANGQECREQYVYYVENYLLNKELNTCAA